MKGKKRTDLCFFVYSELIFIFKVTIWENTYYVIYKEWVWEGLGSEQRSDIRQFAFYCSLHRNQMKIKLNKPASTQ